MKGKCGGIGGFATIATGFAIGAFVCYLYSRKSSTMSGLAGPPPPRPHPHHHGGGGGHYYGGGWGGGYPLYTPVEMLTVEPCAGVPCPAGYLADPRMNCRCTRVVL